MLVPAAMDWGLREKVPAPRKNSRSPLHFAAFNAPGFVNTGTTGFVLATGNWPLATGFAGCVAAIAFPAAASTLGFVVLIFEPSE